jgi:hypothetical protein
MAKAVSGGRWSVVGGRSEVYAGGRRVLQGHFFGNYPLRHPFQPAKPDYPGGRSEVK